MCGIIHSVWRCIASRLGWTTITVAQSDRNRDEFCALQTARSKKKSKIVSLVWNPKEEQIQKELIESKTAAQSNTWLQFTTRPCDIRVGKPLLEQLRFRFFESGSLNKPDQILCLYLARNVICITVQVANVIIIQFYNFISPGTLLAAAALPGMKGES